MRKFYILLIILSSFETNAQWVTIPDSNFVTFLQQNYPGCMNGNQMDTTCSAIINETVLNCSYKNISDLTGITHFDNLIELIANNNFFIQLPILPPNLEILNCQDTPLQLISQLPGNLKELLCGKSSYIGIGLTTLPQLPPGLIYLGLTGHPIASLPQLPDSLQSFYCNGCLLSTIPELPNSLKNLGIGSNLITNIQGLPSYLETLYLWSTQITSLPTLPGTLTYLNLRFCYQINTLPFLPNSLKTLDIDDTSINCLPPLNNLSWLYFNNTNIQCVPEYNININSSPSLTAFPLCNSSLNVQINSQYTSLCDTNFIMIEANTGSGFIYQWQLNGNNIQGADSNTFQATSPGNYRVIVMSGCMIDTSNVISMITGSPNATISALGPTTFCNGGYITLKANTGTGLSYQWSFNGNIISGANSSTYFATIPGIYSVLVSNICGATNSNNININTTNIPPDPISIFGPKTVCPNTIHFFSVTPVAGATNYNWTVPPQASIISGQGTYSITVTFANNGGNVTVFSANQCGASNSVILNVKLKACYQSNDDIMRNDLISNQEFKFNLSPEIINIYPNPSSGNFNIIYLLPQNKEGVVEIFDINGRIVFTYNLAQWSTLQQFNLPQLSQGIYAVKISSDGYNVTKKVIITK